ncbi:MAG: carbohydrate ABC transporter permease [Chloroflexota bacterium]|nr:carbohydrate ABC transporter permease [Chloroflexota bacterium]
MSIRSTGIDWLPRRRPSGGRLVIAGLLQLVLLAYAAVVVYPLLIMVVSSLKTTGEIFQNPLDLIPESIRLANYAEAWNQANFATYFKNSVFVSVVSVVVILFFGSMAAYVLARFPFPGNRLIYLLFLAGFMIPIRLAIVPLFIMMRDLRLLDTLWSLVCVYVAGGMPFTIFLLVNFFRHIPRDLEDAAVIDGAGPFQVYYQIMLPLVRPALATVGLFHFLNVWNDFFFPLIFIRSEELRTIPLGISTFFGEYSNDWALLFAGLSISIVPVIIVYLLTSKQFISGLTAGAIK